MPLPYPQIRLFVEASLHAASSVPLTEGQAHYLLNVMRLAVGSQVAVFNGRDGEWRATLQPISKKKADLLLVEPLKPQSFTPDVWLVFAPIKHGRIDFLAEKATELGASALVPVMTARTIASRVNTDRLQANAIEAAEQCERMEVPPVREPQSFAQLLAGWPQDRILIYGDETGQGLPPGELLPILPASAGTLAVLVGPEGGFTPAELEQLRQCPFARAISLGPRVLRADTAGLAALTCVMAWRGDWDNRPRFERN
jgi:16S rRNA (uracil1498-N3)-methyltransferase